jgi:hypothetical protein
MVWIAVVVLRMASQRLDLEALRQEFWLGVPSWVEVMSMILIVTLDVRDLFDSCLFWWWLILDFAHVCWWEGRDEGFSTNLSFGRICMIGPLEMFFFTKSMINVVRISWIGIFWWLYRASRCLLGESAPFPYRLVWFFWLTNPGVKRTWIPQG